MSPTSKGANKFADYVSSIFVAYILRRLEAVSKLAGVGVGTCMTLSEGQ